jgi:four helix bundle protein
MELAVKVYRGTKTSPKHELYGLTSQMRRAAISVPSNIAEGKGHSSDKDFRRFLFHARGSLMGPETQIVPASKLQYLSPEQLDNLQMQATQVGKSLAGLLNALSEAA